LKTFISLIFNLSSVQRRMISAEVVKNFTTTLLEASEIRGVLKKTRIHSRYRVSAISISGKVTLKYK